MEGLGITVAIPGQYWGDMMIMLLGGALAASSFILAKKPDAKVLFEKVAPYQGTIGVVMFFWGIWRIIYFVLNLGDWKDVMFGPSAMGVKFSSSIGCKLYGINWLATGVVMAILGFLLGFGMIQAYAGKKNPAVAAKSEAAMKKLAPHQTWLGFTAIILAVLWLLLLVGIPKLVYTAKLG